MSGNIDATSNSKLLKPSRREFLAQGLGLEAPAIAVGGRARVAEIGLWLTFDPAMTACRRPKMESRFPVDKGLVGVTFKPWRPGLPLR